MEEFLKKIDDLGVVMDKLKLIKKNPNNEDLWISLALNNNYFQLEVLNVTLGHLDRRFKQERV